MLLLHRRDRGRLFRVARRRARGRAPAPGDDGALRRCGCGCRLPAAVDLRPGPARALPEHAARLQGHLADERRQLDPRRLELRELALCLPARNPPVPPDQRCRARGRSGLRSAARRLHRHAVRRHRDPRLARGAARAAVPLRLERSRERGRRSRDRRPSRRGRAGAPARGRRRRRDRRRDGADAPPARRPRRAVRRRRVGHAEARGDGPVGHRSRPRGGPRPPPPDPKYTVIPQRERVAGRG